MFLYFSTQKQSQAESSGITNFGTIGTKLRYCLHGGDTALMSHDEAFWMMKALNIPKNYVAAILGDHKVVSGAGTTDVYRSYQTLAAFEANEQTGIFDRVSWHLSTWWWWFSSAIATRGCQNFGKSGHMDLPLELVTPVVRIEAPTFRYHEILFVSGLGGRVDRAGALRVCRTRHSGGLRASDACACEGGRPNSSALCRALTPVVRLPAGYLPHGVGPDDHTHHERGCRRRRKVGER